MNAKSTISNYRRLLTLLLVILFAFFSPLYAAQPSDTQGESLEKIQENVKEFQESMQQKMQREMRTRQRQKMQDLVSGVPQSVLDIQSLEPIIMPPIDEAVKIALKAAADAAEPLIDKSFHNNGKKIRVPDDYKSIQSAIDAAASGDTVVVMAGTYFEQLIMKDGVKLVSDSSDNGDELVAVPNSIIKLPRRTIRTIIDGSKTTPSKHGMVDFDPGLGRKTIIDGFTIQNLPLQNHHIPGHAHGLNIRGASPVITNCLINNMGSTGIGSHVVYNDQENKIYDRDFRWDNIKHMASAVLYNNIVHDSIGLGIGCNHFASPYILGNEVYANSDAQLGSEPSPGIGNQHGSFATIIGNIVHDNPGGGIMAQKGMRQGKFGVDRKTHPTIIKNIIYNNGDKRPAITGKESGSLEMPIIIKSNFIYNSGSVGVGITENSVGIIEENMVTETKQPAVTVNKSIGLKLNHNKVTNADNSPGITIVNDSVVYEMVGNAVENDNSPRFLVDKSSTVRTPPYTGK